MVYVALTHTQLFGRRIYDHLSTSPSISFICMYRCAREMYPESERGGHICIVFNKLFIIIIVVLYIISEHLFDLLLRECRTKVNQDRPMRVHVKISAQRCQDAEQFLSVITDLVNLSTFVAETCTLWLSIDPFN